MRDHYDRGPARDRDDRRSSYGRDRDSDRGEREMFPAVCDECGKDCQVPFRPSGNKPIFCSSCFEKQQDGGERSERRDYGRDREERPSFRRDDRRESNGGETSNIQRQLDDINSKLYKIMKMLEPKAAPVYNKMEPVKKRAQKAFEEIVEKVEEVTPEVTEKTEEAA